MSISLDYAMEHKNSPAVLCCRAEAGIVISEHNLEDPVIFDDLVDSGLLKIDGAITIEQALGATLNETYDSLTPLTPDKVTGIKSVKTEQPDREAAKEESVKTAAAPAAKSSAALPGGTLKIHIGEGKDINLEIPVGISQELPATDPVTLKEAEAGSSATDKEAEGRFMKEEDAVRHTLKNYTFPVKDVIIGDETKFENGVLTVRSSLVGEAVEANKLVVNLELDVIRPEKQDVYTNTMMDIQPIAVKKEGELGEGITYEMTGVYMMLTGTDEAGLQVAEANVSCGIYEDNVKFGRPGSPDKDAFIIRLNATIVEGTGMERPGPLAAHTAMDVITQEIREVLKEKDIEEAAEERVYEDIERRGRLRVLLVKEIMGQGAMHDNLILPNEPCGVQGGRANVDMGNVPVFLRTNEVRDGGIHALTCITPDTKETSLYYWREPYLKRLVEDEEIDLVGVLFVGSPQANTEKFYVSRRVGAVVESMCLDGCIVTTEGFGNNHIDFASHIEQIGMLGIPVVGCSYCGVQGALVVGNKYMDAMIDHCVTDHGNVEDILQLNTGTYETALRAVALLKNKIAGVKFAPAERKYSIERIESNLEEAKEVYE